MALMIYNLDEAKKKIMQLILLYRNIDKYQDLGKIGVSNTYV
jgi:hypothetical protein